MNYIVGRPFKCENSKTLLIFSFFLSFCTHVALFPQSWKHWLRLALNTWGEHRWVRRLNTAFLLYSFSQVQCRIFACKSKRVLDFRQRLRVFCRSQWHVAIQKTSASFAPLQPPASTTTNIAFTLKCVTLKKTKTLFGSAEGGAFRQIGVDSGAGSVSFFFPGGGKIALFLGNFITFLYIMQSL